MLRRTAYHRVIRMVVRRMIDALVDGRYPPPYTVTAYQSRDKSKAFRCIAYQDAIRDVSALTVAAESLHG